MAEICSTEEETVKFKIYIEKLNGSYIRFVGVYNSFAIIMMISCQVAIYGEGYFIFCCVLPLKSKDQCTPIEQSYV